MKNKFTFHAGMLKVLLLANVLLFPVALSAQSSGKPNIVVIMADWMVQSELL